MNESTVRDEARRLVERLPDDATWDDLLLQVRVRQVTAPAETADPAGPKPFGERYAEFRGAVDSLPDDLAERHDHYRLGSPGK